jgi:hypothetical protein
VSATIRQPVPPTGGRWGPVDVDGRTLPGAPAMCRRNRHISVTMIGKPRSRAFYERLVANEQEHVTDLTDASNQFLVPYYRAILALRATGPSLADCQADLNAQLGRMSDAPIRTFLNALLAGIARRDVPGLHPTQEATNITDPRTCSTMEITAEPTQAPARRGGRNP